ncbi:hypothetical protein [Micromonospora tulbaghiae]|uniref:Chromosome segregation ATPase n=1 Tax=Micromonospora tulbaghiae TaxID=479978 RepID=A0ABY0KQQ3_9ACTN|nr:hypothetical protein [Micromonospora tulbaghiae]SCF01092.1 hypothetical protein GA0070562_5096 [Micromonospora tulbaghiae]
MTITQDVLLPADLSTADGIIAGRLLQSVQLLRVARHTGHVIPIAGGGITVLSGRGPGGASNGAGKSSLAESVLLATADRQWTRGGASAKAVGLLFSEQDAQQGAGTLGNAAYGYIITIWMHANDATYAPLSVWMRIQREGRDRLQVRVLDGVCLALGNSEHERLAHADRTWEGSRGRETYGPGYYGPALFGTAPGAIGYVRNRGADRTPDTGLLAVVDGMRFTPTSLARELIDLCGVRQLIVEEQRQRRQHFDLEAQQAAEDADDRQQYAIEERRLDAIVARVRAREVRDSARDMWRRYLAVGVKHYTSRQSSLQTKLAGHIASLNSQREQLEAFKRLADGTAVREAARAVTEAGTALKPIKEQYDKLTDQRNIQRITVQRISAELVKLDPAVQATEGHSRDRAAAALTDRRRIRDDAVAGVAAAEKTHAEARVQLTHAQAGLAGTAGDHTRSLRERGISAAPLMDLVDLAEDQRSEWEPRLALLADAIIVEAVTDDVLPLVPAGTVLVEIGRSPDGLDPRRPDGPGTHPLDRLLADLSRRWRPRKGVVASLVDATGVVVRGAYPTAQTGRAGRLSAARDALAAAQEAHRTAAAELVAATDAQEMAQRLLDAFADAGRHAELCGEHDTLIDQLKAGEESYEQVRHAHDDAVQTAADATYQFNRLMGEQRDAQNQVDQLTARIDNVDRERQGALSELASLPLDGFSTAYHAMSPETDADTLAAGAPAMGTLRNQVAARMRDALTALPDQGLIADSTYGPAVALTEFATWCAAPTDELLPIPFDELVAGFDRWLEIQSDGDEAERENIQTLRQERRQRIDAVNRRIANNIDLADTARTNAKNDIKRKLGEVQKQLRQMWLRAGRAEINLHITHTEPSSPDEPLTWHIDLSWRTHSGEPLRRYTDKINTAEFVLVHTMLAAAALSCISNPHGRLIVIDEFGQNLDMVNMPAVVDVLSHIAQQYGLTVILACQDIAAPLITRQSDILVEVQHVSSSEALNRAPYVTGHHADADVVRMLADGWVSGRPVL